MEAALIQAIGALGLEAMKTWGLSTIPVFVSGLIWWRAELRLRAKDSAIEALRAKIDADREKRFEELRSMIEVTRSGTEAMTSRSQDDVRFHGEFARLTAIVQELADRVPASPRSRRPR